MRITQPDDWHVHLRDGKLLKNTINDSALHFSRILVMPNLLPPLTNIKDVLAYRKRILQYLQKTSSITPYMTLYLNKDLSIDNLNQLAMHEYILGAKYYPKGATTNSASGANNIQELYAHLEALQEVDAVLQIHGEVSSADIFDREKLFIENYLAPVVKNFPRLRIVLEHVSTKAACDFVTNSPDNIAATITPQHLLYNRNHLLAGGIKPHLYCLPILKREQDQKAIIQAALSGSHKFFAGTDSAPHIQTQKESACGCAGVYSAPFALPLYAELFTQENAMHRLNNFVAKYGAEFYKLSPNTSSVELIKKPQTIPLQLPLGDNTVIPLAAGQTLQWSIINVEE